MKKNKHLATIVVAVLVLVLLYPFTSIVLRTRSAKKYARHLAQANAPVSAYEDKFGSPKAAYDTGDKLPEWIERELHGSKISLSDASRAYVYNYEGLPPFNIILVCRDGLEVPTLSIIK